MPQLGQRPPWIAPALLVSGLLSAAILYILLACDRLPNALASFYLGAPVLNIVYTSYYTVRLVQFRTRKASEALDGSEAWPEVPVYSGDLEYSAFMPLACLMAWFLYHAMLQFISGFKTVSELSGAQWNLEVIYRGLMIAQLLFAVLVILQARALRKAEDPIVCRKVGHNFTCKRCQTTQAKAHATPTEQTPPSFQARPLRTMFVSATACAILTALVSYQSFITKDSDIMPLTFYIPVVTLAFHGISLFLSLHGRPKRSESSSWPSTPRFAGKGKASAHMFSMIYAWMGFCVMCLLFVIDDESVQWRSIGMVEVVFGVVWLAETMILLLGAMEAGYMMTMERQAQCILHGHEWKCKRLCMVAFPREDEKAEAV